LPPPHVIILFRTQLNLVNSRFTYKSNIKNNGIGRRNGAPMLVGDDSYIIHSASCVAWRCDG